MDFNFSVDVEVRFRDLDGMGHVNNSVYFTYFEIARTAYLMKVGRFKTLQDINFIVAHAECDYRRGATMGQRLKVECGVTKLGHKSFTMTYRITTDEGRMHIADGATVMVWYDFQAQQVIECPPAIRARIEAIDGGLLASAS